MIAMIDLSGRRFGRLTVLFRSGARSGQALWHCRCDCGADKHVVGYTLREGQTLSCGCLQKERTSKAKTTHGRRKSRAYNIWACMLTRCNNESTPAFKDYGGRGIGVCESWKSFDAFYADMGEPPSGLTLDRIDNDLGYSPENCRWATCAQQSVNKRSNYFVEFEGRRLCATEWARELGIARRTIITRLKSGLPPEDCLRVTRRA